MYTEREEAEAVNDLYDQFSELFDGLYFQCFETLYICKLRQSLLLHII